MLTTIHARFSLDKTAEIMHTNFTMKISPAVLRSTFAFLSTCLLFIVIATTFPKITHAQYQPNASMNPYLQPNTENNVPANLHVFTQSIVIETLNSVSCVVTGVDFLTQDHRCLGVNQKTGQLGYVSGNQTDAVTFMARMIGDLYRPIMHTSDYVAYLNNHFIGTKKAYAASTGIGFQGLTPILEVWVAFRNIVYLIFVVFFILTGLGIMLRVRLDSKTALDIQSALPKLIIALILVTFSFAIAGLLVDMMYLLSYIIITIMQTADSNIDPKHILTILNQTPMGFVDQVFGVPNQPCDSANQGNCGIWQLVGNGDTAISYIVYGAVTQLVSNNNLLAFLLGMFNIGCWWPHVWNPFDHNVDWASCAGGVVAAITYLVVWLVLYFAILIALFRLWWTMIKSYIFILVDIALAPFLIGMGVLPGSVVGFSGWLRGMVSHLAIFPAAIFMFLLGKVFIDKLFINNGNYFTPPLLGVIVNQNQDAGGAAQFNIGYLIGIGIIFIIPTIQDQLNEILKYNPNKHVGPSLTSAMGFGAAAAGAVAAPMTLGLARSAFQRADPSRGINEGWLRRAVLGPRAGSIRRDGTVQKGPTRQRRILEGLEYILTGRGGKG